MSGTAIGTEVVRSTVTVGFLTGDFPWSAPPPRMGKLISLGVVARNMTHTLRRVARVVPYLPPPASASPDAQRDALAAFLRSIDVLWADTYPGRNAEALALRHTLRLPCAAVLNAQGAVPKALEAMLFPWQAWLRPGDGLLLTCQADRAIWKRLVAWSTLHEWVVPLPIDESLFHRRAQPEKLAARERLGVPPKAPLLLYVGRLNIQKNLHALLRLLAAVRRQVSTTHLCLVGAEDDVVLGEFGVSNAGYVAFLHQLAAALGIAEALHFVGPLFGNELAQAYAAADVLVNASFYHRENFGLSQAEAQACGTPVVCSDWGGFRDVVVPGRTGFLMETVLSRHGVWVDWGTGARYVISLLQKPDERIRVGESAAAAARARYGVDAVAPLLRQVLIEAVASRPIGRSVESICYEPSRFARDYEANKRRSGWYAVTREHAPPEGYPPMFEGTADPLYEQMMEPYATRRAAELAPEEIQPDWVPYYPAELVFEADQRRVSIEDRVWSGQRCLPGPEWEVLSQIDGRKRVRELAAAQVPPGSVPDLPAVAELLWRLHGEGFVLFERPVSTPLSPESHLSEGEPSDGVDAEGYRC